MSEDLQHIVVYGVVIATIILLARSLFGGFRRKGGRACGPGCSCSKPTRHDSPDQLLSSWKQQLKR